MTDVSGAGAEAGDASIDSLTPHTVDLEAEAAAEQASFVRRVEKARIELEAAEAALAARG